MAGVKEEAVNFVVSYLIKDPDTPMRELQELGAKKGINVYPLIMGLAKKKLGIGRPDRGVTRPRSVTPRAARSAVGGVGRRGVSVAGSRDPANMLNNFVIHMKQLEQENQALRGTLQRIADLISR